MVHGLETMRKMNDNEVEMFKKGKRRNLIKLPRGDAIAVRRLLNKRWTKKELGGSIDVYVAYANSQRSPFRGKDVL
ncbi:MAG: hypothetical protein NTY68_03275 [Candidatus Micrarchaeota archaeon]|nr:hypothetical protein [Candidatus Micrarchaeota archaeon]